MESSMPVHVGLGGEPMNATGFEEGRNHSSFAQEGLNRR
jgi:hypothetical protein